MESIVTTAAAIYAFVVAHAAEILGIWVLLEQLIAANPKLKSNSTFQLISNGIKALLGKAAVKK
jgi:hypothetical protein